MDKVYVEFDLQTIDGMTKTIKLVDYLTEMKRDGVEVNMCPEHTKQLKDLFNSILDFFGVDYE